MAKKLMSPPAEEEEEEPPFEEGETVSVEDAAWGGMVPVVGTIMECHYGSSSLGLGMGDDWFAVLVKSVGLCQEGGVLVDAAFLGCGASGCGRAGESSYLSEQDPSMRYFSLRAGRGGELCACDQDPPLEEEHIRHDLLEQGGQTTGDRGHQEGQGRRGESRISRSSWTSKRRKSKVSRTRPGSRSYSGSKEEEFPRQRNLGEARSHRVRQSLWIQEKENSMEKS